MKKLSILIALLLCVTISGVYATWTYTNDQLDITDSYKEVLVELTPANGYGEKGAFEISTNVTFTLDQKTYGANEVNKHEAVLLYNTTDGEEPYLTVTFTPSLNASEEIRQYAVPAELYFYTSTDMNYMADEYGKFVQTGGTAKPIFKFSNESDGEFNADPNNSDTYKEERAIKWGTPNSDGVFSVTYNAEQIKQMVYLNDPIILNTKEDHDLFRTNLNGTIVVNVTDGTVQAGPQG